MSRSAQLCAESAKRNGVDKVWTWTRAAIEQTEFFEQYKDILNVPRGSGLWAWKPYIILETLKRARQGDVVIYADAGVEFIAPVSHVVSQMADIWLFGNMYQHQHWCKADTMRAMNVWPEGKQCQASVLFVKPEAEWFIKDWLDWCVLPHMINDDPSIEPNHPEFKEHRHDQAILTNEAYLHGVALNWWPAVYNNGAFVYPSEGYRKLYPPLFHHHRRRNNEYT